MATQATSGYSISWRRMLPAIAAATGIAIPNVGRGGGAQHSGLLRAEPAGVSEPASSPEDPKQSARAWS